MRRLNFDLVESADTRPSTVYASCLDPCSRLTEAPIFSQTIKQIIVNGRVSADSTRLKFRRRILVRSDEICQKAQFSYPCFLVGDYPARAAALTKIS